MYKLIVYSDELYHYGVKGMRWGIRRYQNYDGTRIGTGGEPVTNQAKAAGNSIALGQGGKANGIARLAAKREPLTKEQKKALADHLTSDNVKQGKGRDNISPLEDATKDVGKITDSSKKLTEIGKKHDPKVKEAGEKAEKEAKKMSDKELRDKINRIKMEREYKSLAEEEVESGWDKAHEILDVAGDILGIMGTLASLYLTYKIAKGKVGIGQSDVSDAENELKSFMESNEFDEEVIAHFMELDDEYVDDFLEHHGVKGMKWGVRRYQNPDGTRIGVGSGSGGGGGGHRADSNPVFQKRRRQKAIESFKNSVAGGQGGKAVGNERLAAKVIPDNETSKYKSSDTQKAVDAWKKHDDIHWNKVDPARDQYFKLKERYGENDKRTKAAQETMIKAIEESDKYAKIAVDKFKNIPYDDIDDDVLRIGQHSATWKYDVKVEDIDKYNGPTIDRWSSSKQDFESYKFESTNPNVEILGDAPGGEIALRRRPKKSDPIADAKAAKDREEALARSEVQDLKDAYRLTGDRSYLKAAKDKEKQLKRR